MRKLIILCQPLTMSFETFLHVDLRADSLARREDRRLLTGRGLYVHDVKLTGVLHAVFARSSHARARLLNVDLQPARDCEGVLAVIHTLALGALIMPRINALLPWCDVPDFPLLASGQLTSVGQPIAVLVASTLLAAQHAAEQVLVDYAAEPAQGYGAADALTVARVGHHLGDSAAVQVVHKVRLVHHQARVIAMSLEPRAAVAQWDPTIGLLTAWLSTQTPSRARADIARTLGLHPDQVRVIAPDVGGAFGAKASVSPEDLVIAFVARHLQASVKWTSPRLEEFTSATQGRGAELEGELWLNAQGRFVHLQAQLTFPTGGLVALQRLGAGPQCRAHFAGAL